MNIVEKYREYYENFDIFDERSYGSSFDYEDEGTSFNNLNFVYLCSKWTFNNFKRIIGVLDHDFIEDWPDTDPSEFTNDDILEPCPDIKITNNDNFKTLNFTLKDEIAEEDLVFMNEKCFRLLKTVFTNLKIIKRVLYSTREGLKVELFPVRINVLILNNDDIPTLRNFNLSTSTVKVSVSRFMHGKDLNELLKEITGSEGYRNVNKTQVLLPESTEMGITESRNIISGRAPMHDLKHDNLSKFDIYDGRLVVFYFKDFSDSWKIKYKIERNAAIAMDKADETFRPSGMWRPKFDSEDLMDHDNNGVVGLSNIGNTCYMNTALQCILHTSALKNFLMSENLEKEINKNNPLGTKGEILLALADLFRSYWRTSFGRINPSKFKYLVGRHLSTFEGFSQHDSQEFLSQILDAVHEDANRILHKPYTETIEGKLEDNDLVVARKSWINFLRRNYSLLIENFYGQFKSTVKCPRCHNTSVTFDPFQIISLSIPTIAKHDFSFFFINADQTEKAIKFVFTAKSLHNFADINLSTVIKAYSEKLKIPAERLQFAMLGFSKQGEVCSENTTVSVFYDLAHSFTTRPKIFLMELNDIDMQCKYHTKGLELYLRTNYEHYDREDLSRNSYEYVQLQKEYPEDPIFTKVLYLTQDHTVRDLYIAVLRKFYHCTSLFEAVQKEQSFFEKLWNLLETRMKDKIFFYLKVGNTKLTSSYFDKKIGDLPRESSERLVVNVFINSSSNTTSKVDLSKLLSCSQDKEDDLIFESQDLESYKGEYSLHYLFNSFSKPEVLARDNAWYCSKCKEHVQATKSIQIYKAPRYLVVHLKKLKSHSKKLPLITFPIDMLDLDPYVLNKEPTQAYNVAPDDFIDPIDKSYYMQKNKEILIKDHQPSDSLKYKLYGVVNHYGGQHFGHYTSYCEAPDNQWYEFNDASSSRIDKDQIVGEGAYLLFYKKIEN